MDLTLATMGAKMETQSAVTDALAPVQLKPTISALEVHLLTKIHVYINVETATTLVKMLAMMATKSVETVAAVYAQLKLDSLAVEDLLGLQILALKYAEMDILLTAY